MGVILFNSHFDDKHRVLLNKLHITDAAKLEAHIARLSFVRVAELEANPLPGDFDIRHLRAIHRHIFQDIFPWAGDFREVTTSRTNSFSFPPPQYLIPSLETLFAALKAESHLQNLDSDQFAQRAAHYLGEINAIHPSAKATAAPSANSSASWPSAPTTPSPEPPSLPKKTTKPPASASPPATPPSSPP